MLRMPVLAATVSVRVLVRGTEACCRVAHLLWLESTQSGLEPLLQGDGWWVVTADAPAPVKEEVLAVVREAGQGLLWSQSADPTMWQVLLVGPDGLETIDVPAGARCDQVATWVSQHKPAKRSGERLDRDRDHGYEADRHRLDDQSAGWLAEHGWKLHRGYDTTRILAGCVWNHSQNMFSQFVGERYVPPSASKWVMGITEDCAALWDRDNPGALVQTWPKGFEGVESGRVEFIRRAVVPVLEEQHQFGARRWGTVTGGRADLPALNATVLVHMTPEGNMSAILVTAEGQTTLHPTRRDGRVRLMQQPAERLGLQWVDGKQFLDHAVRTMADACAYTEAGMPYHDVGPWADVPDGVGPNLADTITWLRARLPNQQ